MGKTIPQYNPVFDKNKLAEKLSEYAKSDGWYTEFTYTRQFEQEICNFLGVKYCHVVNNGTIAISLALLAAGVSAGDIVLVPDLTMIATYNAVKLIGAVPYLVDVDNSLCLDIDLATRVIEHDNVNVRAVVYVSFNGRMGDANKIAAFKAKYPNIIFIEDAAQSFGSRYENGDRIGTNSVCTTFSFSPPKIITTGQGGCIVTNDEHISDNIKWLKDFGRSSGGIDDHPHFGINAKFTDIQAIIGLSQLETINTRMRVKRDIYRQYKCALDNLVIHEHLHFTHTKSFAVPWFVDIYCERRDALAEFLLCRDIYTRKMYPPIHSQPSVSCTYKLLHSNAHSALYSETGLWLPSSLTMSEADIDYVCCIIMAFFNGVGD